MTDPVILVIPCFNEAERLPIPQLLEQTEEFSALVLVNDGSSDDTARSLKDLADARARRRLDTFICDLATNVGKGEAVRRGVHAARERYPGCDIALTDADLSTPLPEMVRLVRERARRGVDIVQGARVVMAGRTIVRSPIRHWIGRIGQTLIDWLLKLDIYDTQAGAKVFRGAIADQVFRDSFTSRWLFDCEIFLRARQAGYTIVEEPLWEWRQVGGSSIRPWTYALALGDLLRVAWRYRLVTAPV